MPSKACTECSKFRPIFANGICHACFVPWGEAEGLPPEQMPVRCPAEGCSGYVAKSGLCDRHYRRFLDHGTTDKVRVISEQRRHPEYKNWLYLRTVGKLCAEWQTFWAFVRDAGERPGPRYWANRPDADRLYGPDNFEWCAPKLETEISGKTKEGRREYQKARRDNEPKYWVGTNLKRYYGITREQYDQLLADQAGHCALCDKTEDRNGDGVTLLLAVDHNHATGEIRGLLCRDHNVMLGYAADNADALRLAAAYIERDRHTGLFVPKAGEAEAPRKRGHSVGATTGSCSFDGCGHPIKAQGLCPTHYARLIRTGSTALKLRVKNACSVEGCGSPSLSRSLCKDHYARMYRGGALDAAPVNPERACSIDGCVRGSVARGMCQTHYKRWKRRGSPDIVFDTHGRPIDPIEVRAPIEGDPPDADH